MQFRQVPVHQIDIEDNRFRVSVPGARPELTRSIARAGLISPPVLRAGDDLTRFHVVCGFRRLASAAELGWKQVPALILDQPEASPRNCLLRSYEDARSRGELGIFEKAALVTRLLRVAGYTPDQVIKDFLPALQLPCQLPTIDRLLRIDAWFPAAKLTAGAAELAPAVLLAVADAAPADAHALVHCLGTFRWSASRQRETLGLLADVAQLRGVAVRDLIAEVMAMPELLDTAAPLPQRAEKCRQWLRRVRYPQLSKGEGEFGRVRAGLRLSPRISLQEPPDFEGDRYRVQFQFRTRTEFQDALKELAEAGQQEQFDELFRFL